MDCATANHQGRRHASILRRRDRAGVHPIGRTRRPLYVPLHEEPAGPVDCTGLLGVCGTTTRRSSMESTATRRTLLKAALAGVGGAVVSAGVIPDARAAASGRLRPDWHRRIDEIVAAIGPDGTGITVAVSKEGRTVFAKGYGLRDRGLPERFTGEDYFQVEQLDEVLDLPRGRRRSTFDTVYNLGSISKGFTAAAVLLLHERGRLSVHDRLGTFLPDYRRAADVTLLQLMHQVTGIPDYNDFPLFQSAYDAFVASGESDHSAVVAKLESLPLQFPPGSKYAYSNSNFLLLALVVQKVAGMPLGRFLQRHFFDPLRMRDTTQGYPARGSRDVALGYYAETDGVHRAYQWSLPWMTGAGGLTGSARDLAVWDAALSRPGLFRRETLRMMFTPELGGYACGWVIQTHDGKPYIWHNGGMGGFRTMHALFPDQDISVILLSNDQTTYPAIDRSAPKVFDAVREIW
ncbi:class A beta-lactamase-related serine hydrolase [Nonomuraea deserti]|uniref:Class A beta-lactamase-related serine hydrolase n=2 Tax=Nonomuraea deserti TaxID=1848322 RepID=A0A4R4W083_9ACTN|nr:class A beta-lactamase-related serine hydrolase [Nonomuraea deserti]